MRFAAVLLFVVACSGALASEPGQPLDCSDWVMLEPGLACSTVIPADCSTTPVCSRGANMIIDNTARQVFIRSGGQIGNCGNAILYRTEIVAVARNSSTETRLAYVLDRCGAPGSADKIWANGTPENGGPTAPPFDVLTFDDKNGRLSVPMHSECVNSGAGNGGCPSPYPGGAWLMALDGFTTIFDVLQTFTPQPALGFRVPYMPEGMGGVDHFNTYWGALAHPVDFTQAHPLQCDYPAAPPHVGDYLTVVDTVPTPAPGQGVYYVTAATYQGATRYGRKTTAGRLRGRDPAVLPVCVQP
jgi:hypothetical protein